MTSSASRVPKLPLLLFCLALPVAFWGAKATAGPSLSSQQMQKYAQILTLVEERAQPVPESKKLIYASIHGMLNTLDPHTNFLDDEAYREMREDQRGSFYGLGIVISKPGRYQPLKVVSPIADTPAARLGVRPGDVITHIRDVPNDVDVDTLGLTIGEAVKYLRGPKGTAVTITIDRPGVDEPIRFDIKRDAVKTPAVDQTFMVDDRTGYLHITNFAEATTAELDEAIDRLGKQGANRLIIDLSRNPGGLLEQAISVSSRFLEPGELVVYTEGRLSGSRQDYPTLRDSPSVEWPVVVIVDNASASASEIVSGALQDHDRAIVIGQTTFGKGLVQSVYPLSENTGLALTTQKYYSPLGRTIQRDFDEEERYYFEGREDEEGVEEEKGPAFRTATGRNVYGGGGITPDITFSEPSLPDEVVSLIQNTAISRFVYPLSDQQRSAYGKNLDVMFSDFATFVAKDEASAEIGSLDAVREPVTTYLRAELALVDNGTYAKQRVLLESSKLLQRALEAFPQSEELLAARRELQRTKRAAR